jgi:hypothetical protein
VAKSNTRAARARNRSEKAETPDAQPSAPVGDTLLPELAAEIEAVMTAEASQARRHHRRETTRRPRHPATTRRGRARSRAEAGSAESARP